MNNDYYNKCYKRCLRSLHNQKPNKHCYLEHNRFNDTIELIAYGDRVKTNLNKENTYIIKALIKRMESK